MLVKKTITIIWLVVVLITSAVAVTIHNSLYASNPDPNNYRVPLIDDADISRLGIECPEHSRAYREGITFMDINAEKQDEDVGTPIYASGGGTVTSAGIVNGYGLQIIHDDNQVAFRYAHLIKTYVAVNDQVAIGDLIGLMGSTGTSTGGHLHWEAWPTGGGSFNIYDIPGVNEIYGNPCGASGGIDGSPVPSNPFTNCPDYYAQGLPGVTLFDHANCQGNMLHFSNEPDVIYYLDGYNFDDRVRSFYVHPSLSVVLFGLSNNDILYHCHENDMWDLDTDQYDQRVNVDLSGESISLTAVAGMRNLQIGWDPYRSSRYPKYWQQTAWNLPSKVLVTDAYCFENFDSDYVVFDSAVYNAGGGVDTLPPVTDINYPDPDGNNGWHVSPVNVWLSAYDEAEVAHTYYQINGGTVEEGTQFTLSNDAIYNVCYWSDDINGNVEDEQCVEIKLDQTPPVTTGSVSGPRDTNGIFRDVVLTTMIPIENLSEVDFVECSWDNAQTWQTIAPWNFDVSGNGVHQFFCRSQDLAGNMGEMLDSGPIIINMYVIFSRSSAVGFGMDRSTNIHINGDIYSEGPSTFVYNTGVYINDSLEVVNGSLSVDSSNTNINIGQVVENAAHVDAISYPFSYYWSRCTNTYSDGLYLNDTATTMEGVVCVNGDFTSVATGVSGDVTFVVNGNINFAPTCGWYFTNDPDNGMIMYAAGDIVLAGNCYDILGLVYAKGTISNQSTNTITRGSYVADHVEFVRSTGVELGYAAGFALGTFDLPLDNASFADPEAGTVDPAPTPQPTNTPVATSVSDYTPTPTPTESPTSTPTQSPTITVTPLPSVTPDTQAVNPVIYTSSTTSFNGFEDGDVAAFEQANSIWELYFYEDAFGSFDVDCFILNDDKSILISFDNDEYFSEVGTVEAYDIVKFTPNSPETIGYDIDGAFETWFVGSDFGLSGWDNIDACTIASDRLIVSFDDDIVLDGLEYYEEDLVSIELSSAWIPEGSWFPYLDSLYSGIDENIQGLWVADNGDVYVTFDWYFDEFDYDDIVICHPEMNNGVITNCVFELFWDGDEYNMSGEKLDAVHLVP